MKETQHSYELLVFQSRNGDIKQQIKEYGHESLDQSVAVNVNTVHLQRCRHCSKCKRNRSALEWIFGLIIMLLLCCCAVLAAEFGLLFVRQRSQSEIDLETQEIMKANLLTESSVVCLSPDCLQEASKILSNGNFRADPCSDFYQFACGGYEQHSASSLNQLSKTIIDEKTKSAQDKIRAIISEPPRFSDPISVRKAKAFYSSCIDVAAIEERRLKPLQTLIDRMGGWPVVKKESWKEVGSWIELANRFRKLNMPVNFFFEPRVTFQGDKKLRLVLGLSAAIHGLYSVSDESKHEEYYQRLVDVAVLFGADESRAKQEMRYVFFFETMVKYTYWEHFSLNEMHVTMELSQLQNLAPSVNWTRYLSNFLPFQLHHNDTIVIDSPRFIPKFVNLLQETDTRTLTNYAVARIVWSSAPLLSNKLKRIVGIMTQSHREKECSDITGNYFAIPLASFYVRQHFHDHTKAMTEDITEFIKAGFHISFEETSWNNATMEKAKQRINDINTFIGYPEDILNETSIDELYDTLTMNPKEYFTNYRKILLYLRDRGFKLLQQSPETLTRWEQNGGAALADSIMYFYRTETIFIPAIIIQEVFEVHKNFHYTNFASLGASIASEIAKGLRISGDTRSVRNNIGHPNNDTMWCVAKQFLNSSSEIEYHKQSMFHDYELPWEEIEDYIDHYRGLQAAYKAYIFWRQEKGWLEPVYPGMNFTANQLFWISFANVFCSKPAFGGYFSHRPYDKTQFRSKLRVNIAVSNMPQFARDFHCEKKSEHMNPHVKCTAW